MLGARGAARRGLRPLSTNLVRFASGCSGTLSGWQMLIGQSAGCRWGTMTSLPTTSTGREASGALISPEADDQMDANIRNPLPAIGWREITVRKPPNSSDASRCFAAPGSDGWVRAGFASRSDGPPTWWAFPHPRRLRPTKDLRRKGLRLEWSAPIRLTASELTTVTVTLVNTADTDWIWDPEDHGFVHGQLFDDEGPYFPFNSAWFRYSHADHPLRNLHTGEAMKLRVNFGPDAAHTSPGHYTVRAHLRQLDLRSDRIDIEIT